MRPLTEVRNYLPEPKTHQELFRKSLGLRAAAILGSIGLILSAAAPLPTVRTDFGLGQTHINNPNVRFGIGIEPTVNQGL